MLTRHTASLIILQRTLGGGLMKKELMEILACPVCKGELALNVEQKDDQEIVTGSLHCAKCPQDYPIRDTIPNLLPPDMRN
jgi:uncharacterized protein YbaR (Trm112 family)